MRAILPLNLTAEGMVVSVDHFVRLVDIDFVLCCWSSGKAPLVVLANLDKKIGNCIGIKSGNLLRFGPALALCLGKNECRCDAAQLSFPKTTRG